MKTVARTVLLAGVIALLGLVVPIAPGGAHVSPEPTADIQSVAGLAPDAQSVDVQVLASCPERWTAVEAVVTVSQPGASGQASFPLTCIGSTRLFFVTVPSAGGAFQLGDAQVLPVQPTVLVALAARERRGRGLGGRRRRMPRGHEWAPVKPGRLTGLSRSGSGAYVPICERITAHVHRPRGSVPGPVPPRFCL